MLDLAVLFAILVGAPVAAGALSKYERDHNTELGSIMIMFLTLVCIVLTIPALLAGMVRAVIRKVHR